MSPFQAIVTLLRRGAVVAVAVVVSALAVAACGSSDSSSDTTSASTQSSEAPASTTDTASTATKSPYKLMMIASVGSPAGDYPEGFAAARAAALAINARGGVDGHPIEIVECNEKGDPNAAVECARSARSDGVLAVMANPIFSALEVPILERAGIPYVTGPSGGPDMTSPVSFPIAAGNFSLYYSAALAAKQHGITKLGAITIDVPFIQANVRKIQAVADKAGVEFTKNVPFPPATTDFAPAVQQVADSGAQAALLITTDKQAAAIISTAQSIAPDLRFVAGSSNVTDATIKELGDAANGITMLYELPPATATEVPGVVGFNRDMDAAAAEGITPTDRRSAPALRAWTMVNGLAEVARTIQGDATAESMQAALRATTTPVDVAGMVEWAPGGKGPAEFPRLVDMNVFVGSVEDDQFALDAPEPVDVYSELGIR